MRIKLMNLDRSADRLARFRATNGHLTDVSRFPAIDGQRLDLKKLIDDGTIAPGIATSYRRGALGNALSHIHLWKTMAAGGPMTVCEDDAIFNRQFETTATAVIASLPPDWSIVLWGWNFNSVLVFDFLPGVSKCVGLFDEAGMRAGVERFQSDPIAARPFRLLRAFGTVCYTVSPAGAQALAGFCTPMPDVTVFFPGLNRSLRNAGVDIMMSNFYPQLQAYVSFPPLVVSKQDDSTLGPG